MIKNPLAPDPGPQPEDENLTNDQTIAKYGLDLKDADIREQILKEMTYARILSIAVNRKSKIYDEAYNKWSKAYMERYGTDEG